MENSYKALLARYAESAEFGLLAPSSKKNYLFFLTKFQGITEKGLVVVPLDFQEKADLYTISFNKPQTRRLWLDSIAKLRSPKAQGVALRLLKVVFNWAYRNDLAPKEVIGDIRGPEVNRPERKAFTKEEVARFPEVFQKEDFPEYFKPYIKCAQFCFETGMRPNEAESLTWDCVRPPYVAVMSAKRREVGKVSRLVRITDGVAEILNSMDKQTPLIFMSSEGKPLNKDVRSRAMTKLCQALGIPRKEFYATRRGLATEMFNADYDITAIKAQLGHRSIKTTEIYIQPTLEASANKFKGL